MNNSPAIPAIILLPSCFSLETLSLMFSELIEAKQLGKIPSHLCKALSQLHVQKPIYQDEEYRCYSVEQWYELACQISFPNGKTFSVASTRAFYNHLSAIKKTDALKKVTPSDEMREVIKRRCEIQPTQWLKINRPDVSYMIPKKTFLRKPVQQSDLSSCLVVDQGDITHGGSLHITSRLLNHFVNISTTPCFSNIEGEVKVKDAKTKQQGTVWVRASSPRHLPVMDASHVVLVNIIYKLIIYRLASLFTEGTLKSNYKSLFGFSKASLSKYMGKTDGGVTRQYFDSVMEVITSTRFEIKDKGGAGWFFKKLALVDDNGNPFSKSTIQLLLPAGERSLSPESNRSASPTHIYVRMAPHLDDHVRSALIDHETDKKALSAHDFHSLLQYPRQRALFNQSNGIMQLFVDYFAYRLVSPGAFYVSELSSLLKRVNYSVKEGQALSNVVFETLKTMLHPDAILCSENIAFNSRNQLRADSIVSIINDRYLIRITPLSHHTQLSKRQYEFSALHITQEQAEVICKRQALLRQHNLSNKQTIKDLKSIAVITQVDHRDSNSLMSTINQWLVKPVNNSVYAKPFRQVNTLQVSQA